MAVYDNPKTDSEEDQLRQITGISPDEEGAMEREAYNGAADDIAQKNDISPKDLALAEKGPAKSSGEANNDSANKSTESPSFRRRAGKFLKSRRGRYGLIGGGVVGLGIGGLLMMLSIFSGPFQLVHLSEILQKTLANSNIASENRLNKLFRYTRAANSGDIGDTRVGRLGSITFRDTITKLKAAGIEFDRVKGSGNPKAMTIDTSKNPELRGLSREAAINNISEKFGIPKESIIRYSTGGGGTSVAGDKFYINTRDMGIKATRALTRNSLTYLEGGKIVTGIRFRVMAKFFNTPSLFHPLEKAKASVENKVYLAADTRAAEEKRMQERTQPTVDKAAEARATIKDKLSGLNKAISSVLLLTSGMCLVREVADAVVTVNNFNIVMPSEIQAVDKISLGQQVNNGTDFDQSQLGAASDGFVDKDGKSIWSGRALGFLASGDTSGEDLGQDYRQAFSNDTTAAKIKKFLGGGWFGAAACSKAGYVAQIAAQLALVLATPVTGGASDWALFALKASAEALATAGVMIFLEHQATNLLQSKAIVPDLLSGPLGGNLLAYGARASANTGMRASGGIALTAAQEAYFNNQQQTQEDAQFKSESFFARMFDINDYRSASSRFADNFSPSLSQNASMLVNKFMNFGSAIPQAFSSFIPKAHADTTYDWGFPAVGIPESILDDPATEDPYANASAVATLLDSSSGDKYIEKANTCFGVTIAKTDGLWDATPNAEPVNPNSDEYSEANCNKVSDSNWKRVMLFVLDTRTMKAAACYQGDDASCEQDISSDTTNTSSGPVATGDSKQIAQEILQNPNITYIFSAKDDVELAAQGKPGTNGVPLNIKTLQIVWALGQKHHLVVSAYESYGQGHSANSAHYTGNAVDIATIDGIDAYKNITSFWSIISPYSGGATYLQGDCPGAHTPPSGMNRLAGDTCNHQHIQF